LAAMALKCRTVDSCLIGRKFAEAEISLDLIALLRGFPLLVRNKKFLNECECDLFVKVNFGRVSGLVLLGATVFVKEKPSVRVWAKRPRRYLLTLRLRSLHLG